MTPQELREARLAAGLTTTQLGAALSVSARTIQRWESGNQPIRGPQEISIRTVLGERSLRAQRAARRTTEGE